MNVPTEWMVYARLWNAYRISGETTFPSVNDNSISMNFPSRIFDSQLPVNLYTIFLSNTLMVSALFELINLSNLKAQYNSNKRIYDELMCLEKKLNERYKKLVDERKKIQSNIRAHSGGG